jgi:surface antigen
MTVTLVRPLLPLACTLRGLAAALPTLALTAVTTFVGAGALYVTTGPAQAAPPPHAPAHGWRKKNDPTYRGYTGTDWARDYGVRSGRCDTDEILTAIGAVAGGVIGNRTASDGDRTVATIVGAVIGGVVGHKIGDAIDDRDRACIGHSLELASSGQPVTWRNPSSGIEYVVRPVRDGANGCREFELVANRSGKKQSDRMYACRENGGAWEFERR